MNKKTLAFKPATKPTTPDAWIENHEKPKSTQPTEPTKRLTVDIPQSLHKRIRSACAERDEVMAETVRRLLRTEFE